MKNPSVIKNVGFSLLSEGKTLRIFAHGYSMYPNIKPGSLILIEPIRVGGPPRPGEIIAIKRESGLVVHRLCRIIKKNGITWYIARGDSNAYSDNPVKLDKIAGRIIRAEGTANNPVPANISANSRPNYFINRLRVIAILAWKKFA